jgi:hypothetical protein
MFLPDVSLNCLSFWLLVSGQLDCAEQNFSRWLIVCRAGVVADRQTHDAHQFTGASEGQ